MLPVFSTYSGANSEGNGEIQPANIAATPQLHFSIAVI